MKNHQINHMELCHILHLKLSLKKKKKQKKSNTKRKKDTTSLFKILFKRLFKFIKIKEKEKNIIDSNNNNNISNSSDSNNSSQQVHKTHPLAYHTSRILDDEIDKSKNL